MHNLKPAIFRNRLQTHNGDDNRLYEWVIEGDIEGCFDNIDHGILMEAIERRIADPKVLWLIRRFLKAPVIEKGIRQQTQKGTPQGGVLSPLLANIYLNEFDHYWYENWGKLNSRQRRRQRRLGQASCVLFRYADDFILSARGTEEQVTAIMDSIRGFFSEKLKLTLSAEKTRVVRLEDGFNFLGFYIRRVRFEHYSCVRIRPTQKNLSRLKGKLQAMLGSSAYSDDPHRKIAAMNRVLRGWGNYYRAVNSFQQFRTGDFLAERLFRQWYCRKHQIGTKRYLSEVLAKGRVIIWRGSVKAELFRMASLRSMHSTWNYRLDWKYRSIKNPYMNATNTMNSIPEISDNPIANVPDTQPTAPRYKNEIYLSNRLLAFQRDGWKCTRCGSRERLQAHHIEPVPKRGFDPTIVHRIENLQTLCATCHMSLPKPNG
jgi:group II intron reverse transcriptase/maturase